MEWMDTEGGAPPFGVAVIVWYRVNSTTEQFGIGTLDRKVEGEGFKHLFWEISDGISEPREFQDAVTHWALPESPK